MTSNHINSREFRPSIFLALLIMALYGRALGQTKDSTAQEERPVRREWLRPFIGAYFGGFPLVVQMGIRVGLKLYGRFVMVSADAGCLVAPDGVATLTEYTFRGQLSPPLPADWGDVYLHGYYRLFDRGEAAGGGIGYRSHSASHLHMFGELEITLFWSSYDGTHPDAPEWFPSLGRIGLYYEL
jgi:hypothetical protein